MYHRWAAARVSMRIVHGNGRAHTGYSERGEVAQILPVDAAAAEDVHHVVDDGRGVALAGRGDEADARQFRPCARLEVEGPGVVVVVLAVGPAKSAQGVQNEETEGTCTGGPRTCRSFRRASRTHARSSARACLLSAQSIPMSPSFGLGRKTGVSH